MPHSNWPLVKSLIIFMVTIVATLASGRALAACNAGTVTEPQLINTQGDYDPFSGSSHTTSWSVTVENTSTGSGSLDCVFIVSFHRSDPGNPEFTQGLSYALGGSLSFFSTGETPSTSGSLISSTLAAGEQETLQFTTQINSGQIVAAGIQTDSVIISLYELNTTANPQIAGALLDEHNASPLSVTVAQTCQLPVPDISVLDFSAAINNALPDGITTRTATFSDVACTSAAKLTLSGNALRPSNGVSAVAGYDNFINYEATGIFDTISASLTTNESAAPESSTSLEASNGLILNGTVTVGVRLLRNNPVLAGSYSDTLIIEITPIP